ncbi:MAG: methyl-accepting chemotaxis protein [Oscillospiraceae bacterium]|nr:methyl-accepting chemotaxis protein [Oscillospiraceae bacterium]
MKNLKVSMKLMVSFMIVIVLTAAVGVVGIFGMTDIDKKDTEMYEMQTVPMPYMAKILETMQKMRVNAREYLVASMKDDQASVESTHAAVESDKQEMQSYFNMYSASILTQESQDMFDEARNLFEKDYSDFLAKCYSLAQAGDEDQILKEFEIIRPTIDKITTNFEKCLDLKIERAKDAADGNSSTANMLLIAIIAVLVVAVAVAVVFALYLTSLISKPLMPLMAFLTKASKTGDIELSREDNELITGYATRKDEIGQTIAASSLFLQRVGYISKELVTIASGDLTSDVDLLSDLDVMGIALQQMIANLNSMFSEINAATGQVSIGSKQVADGAQSLAQGSTEQAASVEELSASIADIALKTKANADLATNAASLAGTIKGNAEKGSNQMDEMMNAVREINQASQNISKVIKVIDDIAFQTNILALNAAVEAARAGQHGKGFAVVAEEVRNLAAKSAEAAKETGDMIQNSMEKAELGARIAEETAESLTDIVSGINESDKIVNDIAQSSEVQAVEIKQINVGIDQVAQVIQQNSATAEESAAASEEMSSQANMLEALIAQFRLKDQAGGRSSLPSGSRSGGSRFAGIPESASQPYEPIGNSSGGFGKY